MKFPTKPNVVYVVTLDLDGTTFGPPRVFTTGVRARTAAWDDARRLFDDLPTPFAMTWTDFDDGGPDLGVNAQVAHVESIYLAGEVRPRRATWTVVPTALDPID